MVDNNSPSKSQPQDAALKANPQNQFINFALDIKNFFPSKISFPSTFEFERKNFSTTKTGEIILYAEEAYIWAYINGDILFEEKLSNKYSASGTYIQLELKNRVLIANFFIMYSPLLRVEYLNKFHELTQIKKLLFEVQEQF